MKTSGIRPTKWAGKAFTLIELLFVISIMVALAGLVAGTLGPVKNLAAKQKTRATVRVLETGLAGYQAEYGRYPICEDVNEGAYVLYSSLFGDYNGNGIPDHDSSDENARGIKTFIWDLQPPKIDASGEVQNSTKYVTVDDSNKYYVIDAWGNPIYYACFPKGSNTAPGGGGKHNPTYDIFSMATDNTGSMEERWVKNW